MACALGSEVVELEGQEDEKRKRGLRYRLVGFVKSAGGLRRVKVVQKATVVRRE